MKVCGFFANVVMVPTKGLEPLHPKAHGPEPCASTNSATWALMLLYCFATSTHYFTADNNENCSLLVPTKGLEPLHPKAHGPEPCASTNSATWANVLLTACYFYYFTADNNENRSLLVPTKGLEPLHPKAHGPEPCASTNSATWALCCFLACRCVFCSDGQNHKGWRAFGQSTFAVFFKKDCFRVKKAPPL